MLGKILKCVLTALAYYHKITGNICQVLDRGLKKNYLFIETAKGVDIINSKINNQTQKE